MLAQSPNPKACDKVLDNNPCWFLRREGNRSTRRNTSQSKDENQLRTHKPTYCMMLSPRIELRPHSWEASALNTAPLKLKLAVIQCVLVSNLDLCML